MKQEKNIKTKAQSQNLQGIEDAVAGQHKEINRGYPHLMKFQRNSILDSQGLGRDGPPGRARSPGTLANQFPDHPPDNLMGTNCHFIVIKSYRTHPLPTCGVLPPLFQKERGDPEASGAG